jgi:hypothetical protein
MLDEALEIALRELDNGRPQDTLTLVLGHPEVEPLDDRTLDGHGALFLSESK